MKWNLGLVLLALCSGCSTHLTLNPDSMPLPVVSAPLAPSLVIDLVELKKGGLSQSIDDSLTNRVAMDLRQTRSFGNVIEPIDAHHAPRDAVHLVLVLDANEDPHSVTNGIQAFVTGLSLFLLSPLFRFDFDAEMHAEAVLRTCDGWSKRYTTRAEGSLRTGLFADEERSDVTLRAGVLERALVPLVANIAGDAELRSRAGAVCPGSAAR